jgi:hypothetical protein
MDAVKVNGMGMAAGIYEFDADLFTFNTAQGWARTTTDDTVTPLGFNRRGAAINPGRKV